MASLPDEVWAHILQGGIVSGRLIYRDLCALAIVCGRLNRICRSDSLWKQLAGQDFRNLIVDSPVSGSKLDVPVWKGLYKMRFDKVKEKRMAAHRRTVHRVSSSLLVLQSEGQNLQSRLHAEQNKLLSSKKELKILDHASRTSAALQIWQPHAVTTRHEQVIQQIPVDLLARKNDLKMEIQVCNSNIYCIETTLRSLKSKLEERQKELHALKYNPIQDVSVSKTVGNGKLGRKRKERAENPISKLWSSFYSH